jgi:hypothetical protein
MREKAEQGKKFEKDKNIDPIKVSRCLSGTPL